MTTLLVVEDDQAIGGELRSTLRRHGYEVAWLQTGNDALREARATGFDLVVLDLGLPDLDGVEVCRQLKALQPGCVVVVLTARQDEMDIVVALEAGADDYLTKPVRLVELHARLRAHLRRGATGPQSRQKLVIGSLLVDTGSRCVTVSGEDVPLRAKEFDLLARLAAEPGKAIRREDLMADVWDAHWFGSTKTLDVHIAALRHKLAATAAGPAGVPVIETLRGHGYRLEPPCAGASSR